MRTAHPTGVMLETLLSDLGELHDAPARARAGMPRPKYIAGSILQMLETATISHLLSVSLTKGRMCCVSEKVVFMPEWPAAEALLCAACQRLDWMLAGKRAEKGAVAAQYKALAMDLLASVISLVGNHTRLGALPLAVDVNGDIGDSVDGARWLSPAQGHTVVGAAVDKYFDGHGVFTGFVVQHHEEDPPKQPVALYTVRYADGDEEDCSWKELLPLLRRKLKPPSVVPSKSAAQTKRSPGGGKGRMESLEELGDRRLKQDQRYQRLIAEYLSGNPMKLPTAVLKGAVHFYEAQMHWDMGLDKSAVGVGAGDLIDSDLALGLVRKLAMSRALLRSTPKRLHLLLSLLEPSRKGNGKARGVGKVPDDVGDGEEKGAGGFNARLRQGVLKVLGEAIRADPQVLEHSSVLQAVRQRYIADESALVRAGAVDVLAAYGAHNRRVEACDLSALCTRALDVSAMVRLTASNALAAIVSLGRQYHAKEKAGARVGVWQSQKIEALLRVCRLAVDQEATVRKRALRQVVELWFLQSATDSSGQADAAQAHGSDADGGNSTQGVRAIKTFVDEMVAVAMHTITEQARKGANTSAGEICLLRRVLLRVLDNGKGSGVEAGAAAAIPAKGKSPKGKGATEKLADAAAAQPSAHPAVLIGAEDETMDAGGAAQVIILSESERHIVEQRCRAVCGILVTRIVQLRPRRASANSDDGDDDGPADGKVLTDRLERLLGATATLLSFVQTLPRLVWTIPNVTKLIDTESVDAQALEELVGDSTRLYGLRMRVVAQAALLADAVIATAPALQIERELIPITSTLERHLATSANRVRHHAALNAVIRCLCTLSMTVLPRVGVPEVALLAFCKYVDFLAKFTKQRSQRLLPYVSSALLGAGAYCRFLDWKGLFASLKDGNGGQQGDENAAVGLGRFERYHARMVQMCVAVLAKDPDERVRRCAMQCLGGMLVHSPTLLLQEETSSLVKRALRGETDAASQQAVLEAFRVFLEEEDKDLTMQLRKTSSTPGDDAAKTQRVSDMSTSLANDYLPLILDAAFPRSDSKADADASSSAAASAAAAEVMMDSAEGSSGSYLLRVRQEAIALIKVIMRRGLTAPFRVAPSLIALSAWDDSVASSAAQVFDHLHRKNAELSQPGVIISGVNAYISRVSRMHDSGVVGRGSDGEARCEPLHAKAFASAFAYCAGNPAACPVAVPPVHVVSRLVPMVAALCRRVFCI